MRADPSVCLIGCGGWGRNLARNLKQIGALRIIVDPSDFARQLAVELDVAHLSDLCEVDLTAIDGAVIATPAETHVTVARHFLAARKDVYVEKPIALATSDAHLLQETAAANGSILMVGHLLHYHEGYRQMQQAVQSGRLGKIFRVISVRNNLGLLRNEENVLWSFSPHDISMVVGLLGSPQSVLAVGGAFLQDGIEDFASLHMRYADGTMAEVRASWLHPLKEQELTVIGGGAMAVFDDRRDWPDKLTIYDYTVDRNHTRPVAIRGREEAVQLSQNEPLRAEMEHFLECMVSRSEPRTDACEAIAVLSVLEAAQKSLEQEGQWIDV